MVSAAADPGILSSLVLTALFLIVIAVHGSHAATDADSHLLHVSAPIHSFILPLALIKAAILC